MGLSDNNISSSISSYFYEEELVANKSEVLAFIPELVCGVCNYILKNPLECKTCEKPLCGQCKTRWFAKNPNSCPFCRNKSQFDKVNRMTRNLLSKLKFKCAHNNKGCDEIVSYENLFKHQDSCPTIIFRCLSCPYIGLNDEKEAHNCVTYLTN